MRDYSLEWLKKSFTSFTGEKIIFANNNLIHVFLGDGWNNQARYKWDKQNKSWVLITRFPRTIPNEKTFLTEATAMRSNLNANK